jgi:hypothetical protein
MATSSWLSSVQPSTGVDLLLQLAHFGHQRVEVGVVLGIAHLGRDRVETVDHVGHLARAVLDVLQHGLRRIELRLLLQIATVTFSPGQASPA